jgi:hypothetical protein
MNIATESYAAVYEQYIDAMRWMEGLGIKLSPGRTSHYEKIICHWKDVYKTASAEEERGIFPDFVSSMFEIFDFVSIHKAFQLLPANQLVAIIEKLRKGVNGPINAADETPETTTARNFLFEATVAAKVHRPDRGIEAILDAKSDTAVRINGKKIWIECKRVTTPEKIEGNARKASRQLEELIARKVGAGHRGIVAIDVSKILNKGDQIYVGRNDDELAASVDFQMDQFIREKSQIWQTIYERRCKKIIGTFIRFAYMAISKDRNILVHTTQWAMNPRLGIAESDEQIQRLLAARLKAAP